MMKKTHLVVGIASAMAITNPKTVPECFAAIIGGTIGGLICDIDISDNDWKNNSFFEKFTAAKITAIVLCLDFLLQTGICAYMLNRNKEYLLIGGVLFSLFYLAGVHSTHRTFTHSFAGLFLFSVSFYFIYPPVVYSFAVGFLSHIILDLLNKKKIRLFYPSEFGVCLGLCYADGIVNAVFMHIGTIAMVLMFFHSLVFQCI
uniref:metal-dependent hydrolase n=1 Tax=Agathobacter sp. TaxID=2021311 RepID=UPI004055AC90